ncbi:hypothetical protein JW756_01235 [Candidatus Woesearchaeota archaeon]|nr:hypothetical protein [Candidatus Woesearchaeota archaeon]
MRKYGAIFLVLFAAILSALLIVNAENDLQCFWMQGNCTNGARLFGMQNDTGGFQNAHLQNNSYKYYNYSLCCNNSNTSITITDTCPGNVTVLNLSANTSAHGDATGDTDYPGPVCLSSTWKVIRCFTTTSNCETGICVFTMSNSEGANNTNAHIGNCSKYNMSMCCGMNNTAPTTPTLWYPADNNATVFERKPNFNWTTSTDAEGDDITYTLNISCAPSATCACTAISEDITTTNYTVTDALCVDTPYNWTVIACDSYEECSVATQFNFSIDSQILLTVIVNSTSFADITIGTSNDTTDNSPNPLVVRNDGNVLLNLTINATSLFTSTNKKTTDYQYAAAENETSVYAASCTQTAFADLTTTPTNYICNLTYEDDADQADLEIKITVPPDEEPGSKSSIMTITASQAGNG